MYATEDNTCGLNLNTRINVSSELHPLTTYFIVTTIEHSKLKETSQITNKGNIHPKIFFLAKPES